MDMSGMVEGGSMSMLFNDTTMLEVMSMTDAAAVSGAYQQAADAGYDNVLDFIQESMGNAGDFVEGGELVTSADRTVDGVMVRDLLFTGTMENIDVYAIITLVPADDHFTVIVALFDQDATLGAQVEEMLATLHVL